MAPDPERASYEESRPVPDPTALTTDQLLKAVAALRELTESKIEGEVGKIEARLDAADKAIELVKTIADRLPLTICEKVAALEKLHDGKFDGIATQFKERDTRTERSDRDTKTAVDAALQAAEKAVGKTELSFTKQFDGIGDQIRTLTKSMDDKFDDMKSRLSLIENRTTSSEGIKKGATENWGMIIGVGGFLMGVVMAVVTLVILFAKTNGTS